MVLRRLRDHEAGGRGGAGVSVMMRYTLRLLTLDQLQRAAGLVCALELERERDHRLLAACPDHLAEGRHLDADHQGLHRLIGEKPLAEQEQTLETVFDQWKGELEQVDDICLVGIRF